MSTLPPFLHADRGPAPARSLFEILGSLGPAPASDDERSAPFRAACALEAARRHRPGGPPRPAPHGTAPPTA